MDERKLYRETAHESTVHFAEAWLDEPPRRTRELLQVGRALNRLKIVAAAYEELGWSRTVEVLRVVQDYNQKEWVEFARKFTDSERARIEELRQRLAGGGPLDDHACQSCGRRWGLHVHHIVPANHGGSHELGNLLTLCDTCHTLVHEGRLRITGDAERGFACETATVPARRPSCQPRS